MKNLFNTLLVCMALLLLVGCSNTDNHASDGEKTPSTTDESSQKSIVVYEDDNLKASFNGISDVAGQIGMLKTKVVQN